MFHGSIVAIITPMTSEGLVDYQALATLIDFHIQNGTDAIVVCGSTGEAATLTETEQLEIIRFTLKTVGGKIPVIAGTGTNCTKKTIERSQKAMELGIDACLVVTPYYNKPTQEGLFLHYQTIAKAIAMPIILYNVPGRCIIDLLPETVMKLAHLPNIIGIKESSSQLVERTRYYQQQCGDQLDVYSGDDLPGLAAMEQGAKGIISVVANVAPKQLHLMCDLALKKEFIAAQEINQSLLPLHEKLFVETNPIAVKWALSRMGLIQNHLRLPLTSLSEKHYEIVEAAMQQANII